MQPHRAVADCEIPRSRRVAVEKYVPKVSFDDFVPQDLLGQPGQCCVWHPSLVLP